MKTTILQITLFTAFLGTISLTGSSAIRAQSGGGSACPYSDDGKGGYFYPCDDTCSKNNPPCKDNSCKKAGVAGCEWCNCGDNLKVPGKCACY